MSETTGSYIFQKKYHDESLRSGENPYGIGSMQDELQKLRTDQVRKYCSPNSLVVDIGAGLGESSIAANRLGAEVVAIDVSRLALNSIRNQDERINLVEADGMNLPLRDRSVNMVCLWEVIEHVENPVKLLFEVHRVLHDQGTFLLSTPNTKCLNRRVSAFLRALSGDKVKKRVAHDAHHQEFSYNQILDLVKSANFNVEDWKGYGLAFPIAWHVQRYPFISPLIKFHVYSGLLAPKLAQETYVIASCQK